MRFLVSEERVASDSMRGTGSSSFNGAVVVVEGEVADDRHGEEVVK